MIILLSGPNKRLGFSEEVKKFLNKELKGHKSLVAVAASESSEKNNKYFNGGEDSLGVTGMFGKLDVSINNYYLIDVNNTKEEIIDCINKSDIVYLMGGDPFVQLKLLNTIDYKKLLKDKILIGVSAGSMNLAKYAYYSKDDDYPVTQFYEGLDIVDITIDPHFDINNEEQVIEAKNSSKNHKIIGLPNESGIVVRDNNIEYIGNYYVIEDGILKTDDGKH